MSLASFLTLAHFLGTLLAVGVAAVLAVESIASAAAGQILEEDFWREKGVACVPLAGGAMKVNSRTREDAPVVRPDTNLVQIWSMDGAVRSSRSGWVAPVGGIQPTLASIWTDSNAARPFVSAHWRCSHK
jgi:hypothetical protein